MTIKSSSFPYFHLTSFLVHENSAMSLSESTTPHEREGESTHPLDQAALDAAIAKVIRKFQDDDFQDALDRLNAHRGTLPVLAWARDFHELARKEDNSSDNNLRQCYKRLLKWIQYLVNHCGLFQSGTFANLGKCAGGTCDSHALGTSLGHMCSPPAGTRTVSPTRCSYCRKHVGKTLVGARPCPNVGRRHKHSRNKRHS